MTGPEHYREAERLMVDVASQQRVAAGMERDPKVFDQHWRQAEHAIALAQVHATLALAAVTAAMTLPVSAAREGWPEALGVPEVQS